MPYTYRPRHQRQINAGDPYGGVNCTAYSAAMAIERATMGGTLITGEQVRALSTEPIPDPGSPGLNLAQVCTVARRLYVQLYNRAGDPWSEVVTALRRQQGVILQGDYEVFPNSVSCQAGFRGDHAIYINHLDNPTTPTKAWVQDPLCRTGKYVPLSLLKAYGEKYSRNIGRTGISFATTRTTPLMVKPSPGV